MQVLLSTPPRTPLSADPAEHLGLATPLSPVASPAVSIGQALWTLPVASQQLATDPAHSGYLLNLLSTAFPQQGAVVLLEQSAMHDLSTSGGLLQIGADAALSLAPQSMNDNLTAVMPTSQLNTNGTQYVLVGDQIYQIPAIPLQSNVSAGVAAPQTQILELQATTQHAMTTDTPALFQYGVPQFLGRASSLDFFGEPRTTTTQSGDLVPYLTPDSSMSCSPELDMTTVSGDTLYSAGYIVDPRAVFMQSSASVLRECFPAIEGVQDGKQEVQGSPEGEAAGAAAGAPTTGADDDGRLASPIVANEAVELPCIPDPPESVVQVKLEVAEEPQTLDLEDSSSSAKEPARDQSPEDLEPKTAATPRKKSSSKPKSRKRRESHPKSSSPMNSVRRHMCQVCGSKFLSSGHLSRHRYIHVDSDQKPHKCPISGCTRTFARSDNMRVHYKSHSARIEGKNPRLKAKSASK